MKVIESSYIVVSKDSLSTTVWDQLLEKYTFIPRNQYFRQKAYPYAKVQKVCVLKSDLTHYYIPTGLAAEVKDLIGGAKLLETISSLRSFHKSEFRRANSFFILRDYQQEAVSKMLHKERCLLAAPTGSGKTLIYTEVLRRLGLKTLIIVPTLSSIHQVFNTLKAHCDAYVSKNYGGHSAKNETHNICISTPNSATKLNLQAYRVLIADECHKLAAPVYTNTVAECSNAWYRFGVSGTIKGRSDGLDKLVEAFISTNKVTINKEDIKEFISPVKFTLGIYTSKQLEFIPDEAHPDLYRRGIVQNYERNECISKLCKDYNGHSILVFVKWVEHGKILKELLPYASFLNAETPLDAREAIMKDWSGKTIIATEIFNESIDVPQINVIINAGGGSSEIGTPQLIGRGLRKYKDKILLVYDFVDTLHPTLLKHSEYRLKLYKKINNDLTVEDWRNSDEKSADQETEWSKEESI